MKAIILSAVILALLPTSTLGYPHKAGHCNSGPLGDNSFGAHGADGSGAIEDGDYKIKINKKSVTDGDSISVTAGKEIPIQLKGTKGSKFKGFLLRLSGGSGVDASDSLSVKGSQAIDLDSCGSKVAGICHNNNDEKGGVTVDFNYDSDAILTLEVTVVKENTFTSRNAWYYSSYTINVESDGGGDGDDCPDDEPKKDPKFYFKTKVKTNGEEKVVGKTCKWLQKKSEKQQKKYCDKTESKGELDPANKVCVRTCCLVA